jgi:ABC-type uncharacterized transport system ATPase subunit
MTDPTPSGPLLTMTGMTKQYPGCLANEHVSLTIERNRIHALLGENGACKSTLVKIIYGVVKPDEGEIISEGQKVAIQNPGHAQRLGIGMVFQQFSLFEALTVPENIASAFAAPRNTWGYTHGSLKSPMHTGCRLIRTASSMICLWASGSVSKSFAACCKIPSC